MVLTEFLSTVCHSQAESMATATLHGYVVTSKRILPSFEELRLPTSTRFSSSSGVLGIGVNGKTFSGLVVRAATVIAPKYKSIKPLGDRVLVKINSSEEKTTGGVLLPTSAQSKPQAGEAVAIGEGKTVGQKKVEIGVEAGTQVVYSKYAGTEVEFNGCNHLLLKEDDIVGVLDTDDVRDLRPSNDRILIKVAEAEERTAGGLLLTAVVKEKSSTATVVAVGPGPLDEEGKRKPLSIRPGSTVLFSKFAGSEFKSADVSDYVVLKASDVVAVLSSQ